MSADTSTDLSRRLLRNALKQRDQCRLKLTSEQAALERASDELSQRERQLNKYQGVDQLLAQARTEAEKAFIRSGGCSARQVIPPDVIQAIRERDEVAESVALAKSAVQSLAADVDKAKAELGKAERAAAQSALTIMLEHAAVLGKRLDAVKREAFALEDELYGLSDCWIPGLGPNGEPQPARLSRETMQALDLIPPQHPPLSPPRKRTALQWRAFHELLLRNPNAQHGDVNDEFA
jgi:hypothetical protein